MLIAIQRIAGRFELPLRGLVRSAAVLIDLGS
jgi:hypothetical protein